MHSLFGSLSRRPLAVVAALFTIGVAGCRAPHPVALLVCLASGLGSLTFAHRRRTLAWTLLGLGFFAAGLGLAGRMRHTRVPPVALNDVVARGRVVDTRVGRDGRLRQVLEISGLAAPGARLEPARFRAQWTTARDVATAELLVRGELRPLEPARNPGGYDPGQRTASQGLSFHLRALEDEAAGIGPSDEVERWRRGVHAGFAGLAALASPSGQALIRALATGDRTSLDDAAANDFSASGLAHILSVSGLHIVVVAAGAARLLRWLLGRSQRLLLTGLATPIAGIAALAPTWLYVVLTGSDAPAVRSGLMATTLVLARAFGRDNDPPTSLALAGVAALAWDPPALFDLSFQLSFVSVAGLMLLTAPLRALVPVPPPDRTRADLRGRCERAREALLVAGVASLAATLSTAPLIATAFGRVSLVGVVANMVAVPVAAALTACCATAAMLFLVWPPLAVTPLLFADPLARVLLWLSSAFAHVPLASLSVPPAGVAAALVWYAALLAIAALRERPRGSRRWVAAALLAAASTTLWPALRAQLTRELTVTFLAVGQGDATVLQLPGGHAVLLDGGGDPSGSFDTGSAIVLPALRALGVTHLDAVALSHPHPDHALGLAAPLASLEVDALWVTPWTGDGPLMQRLLSARPPTTPVRLLHDGARFELGGASFEVLHPNAVEPPSTNDGSLVLRVRFGDVGFLLPGDVESFGEAALLDSSADLSAAVLKAPHHGSRTSSSEAFLRRVKPHHVVFCVGAHNRFGFPHEEVVTRYEAAGCQLYRTDLDGAVTFRTDGRRLEVERFLNR